MSPNAAINRALIESTYSKEWVFTPAEQARAKILLKMSGEGKWILDVGCYNGRIGILLRAWQNKIFGTDLSYEALKVVHQKGIISIQADAAEAIPFKDGTFDVLVAAEIIAHVFDLDTFLTEMKRVLKKSGSLVLSTPNLASLGRRIYLLCGKNCYR